jgi:hypothetical protein
MKQVQPKVHCRSVAFGTRLLCIATLCFGMSGKVPAQVTINAGTGAGSFQCTEGAGPTPSSNTDVLWCDAGHYFQMNNNNGTSTSVAGVVDTGWDNTISSSVVTSGLPSFLSTSVSSGTHVVLSGSPAFIAYIGGLRMVVSITVTSTTTLVNGTNSTTAGINFIYLNYNSSITATSASLAATIIPPLYGYWQPTCSASTGSSAPCYWFDLTTRTMKTCNTASCSPSTATATIFLGVIALDNSGGVLGIANEPWNLSPLRRFELFGNGGCTAASCTPSQQIVLSPGPTTLDGWNQYTALEIVGGTVNHTTLGSNAPGFFGFSQNAVLIASNPTNIGSLTASALGRAGGTAGTNSQAGGSPAVCGFGGAGGGGGGGSVTAGGAGASHDNIFAVSTSTGGGGGGAVGAHNGTIGTAATNVMPFYFGPIGYSGCGGGGGGGGASTHTGGVGGVGGGGLFLKAPSITIYDSTNHPVVAADGAVGGNSNNADSGGGGGEEGA